MLSLGRSLDLPWRFKYDGKNDTEVGVESPGRQDFYVKHSDIAPPML